MLLCKFLCLVHEKFKWVITVYHFFFRDDYILQSTSDKLVHIEKYLQQGFLHESEYFSCE